MKNSERITLENPVEIYTDDTVLLVGLDAVGGIQINVDGHEDGKVIFIDKNGDITLMNL